MYFLRPHSIVRLEAVRLLPHLSCPLCGKAGQVTLSLYQRYIYLLFIPVVPARRFGAAHCGRCDQCIPAQADMPRLVEAFKAEAASVRPKIGFYAGGIAMALLAGAVAVAMGMETMRSDAIREAKARQEQPKIHAFLADPHVGDSYIAAIDSPHSRNFGLLKVMAVSGEGVTLRANKRVRLDYDGVFDLSSDFDWDPNAFTGVEVRTTRRELATRSIRHRSSQTTNTFFVREVHRPFVANPRVGDVYTARLNGNLDANGLFKVVSVSGDEVVLQDYGGEVTSKNLYLLGSNGEAFSGDKIVTNRTELALQALRRHPSDEQANIIIQDRRL